MFLQRCKLKFGLVLLVCALICSSSTGSSSSILEKHPEIKEGLEMGDRILDAIDSKEFLEVVPFLAEWSMPFLKALELMIQIIQDKENVEGWQQVRDLLTRYNERLRQMSEEYTDVRHAIDWNTVKVSFGAYERSIIALKQNMENALNAPVGPVREQQQNYFVKMFEHDYNNAANKIYNSMVTEHMIFSENMIAVARRYTRDHRRLLHSFMLGVYKLIMEGVELEITYLIFNDQAGSISFIKKQWDENYKTLQAKYDVVDKEISANWYRQAGLDMDHYASMNPDLGRSEYATYLYGKLQDKFYWRSWMVIVYEPVSGFNSHAMSDCNQTLLRYRQVGRNVAVESVDRGMSQFQGLEAATQIGQLTTKFPAFQKDKPLYLINQLMSNTGFESCYSSKYRFAFVNTANTHTEIRADPKHFVHKVKSVKAIINYYNFNVVLFG